MAYLMSASSAYSVPTVSWKYDVFLSFRGEDTRYNFVDHLHAALIQSGISVFKDDEELKIGKAISPELLKAIKQSKFAVVVFSKNYANSSWCLVELAKIMEWHNRNVLKVIPVFYHVDPSDIRGQKNQVAVFFEQHEERFREEMDKVNGWREALTAAADLTGKHISQSFKVGESTYIREIVEEILHDIQSCELAENNLIGIDSCMDNLLPLLQLEEKEEVHIVGIYGMGGIGKTTIAKTLFRRIRYMFEGSCFVNDVRENSSSKRGLCTLQENLIRDLMPGNYSFNIRDPEDGINMIRARFLHMKVLIVLDDVDNDRQLEFLCATHDSFGPGSRIIITTRNTRLLSDANEKYEAKCLKMHEALELFSRHAFKRNSPPKGYEELSCQAIRCAGHLPLALKLLGSFLRGRKAFLWESVFNRFTKAPNDEIYEILKLSFDGLEDYEKTMFLDIACFFKGRRASDLTNVFKSCGFETQLGISVLVEKCLITINSNEVIGMHDLIQQMGKQIVHETSPNSRLWKLEDIYDSLKHNQKQEAIEAIMVLDKQYEVDEYEEMKQEAIEAIMVLDKQYEVDEYEEMVGFSPNVFEHMINLRLLDIEGRFTSSEPTVLPSNLRWLSWSDCPFSSLQVAQMSKLVGIEVSGAVKQFWSGQKIMPHLKFLKLHRLDCLTTLPDVSVAPNIEKLFLYYCKNLVEVHESLGSHKRIWKLQIIGCERLKRLPSKIEMESLVHLQVNKCSSLETFPDVSPCMVKLVHVSLESCSSIKELSQSFGYLSSLRYLNFRKFPSGRNNNIPICRENESLRLHTLTNLCSLRILNLSYRQMGSEDLPKNLHELSSLEELYLTGNNRLIRLPASISHLSSLKKLNLNECHQLQTLHGLPPRLQELEANNCYSLEKIEDLSTEYENWNHISFVNCQKLLGVEDNERYLDKMFLQQSFLKRCADVDGPLTIAIPGNKIPGWFKEQPGYLISLMMPPKRNTQIIGIVVCGFFPGELQGPPFGFMLDVSFMKDGKSIIQKEVDCIDAAQNGNTWIGYRPCRSLRALQGKDWSGGALLIRIVIATKGGAKAVRCAALLVYKLEDGESNKQIKTCIGRPWVTKRDRNKIRQLNYALTGTSSRSSPPQKF